jgi:flagellar motility protein MotE (MotC chaperone)
VAGSPRVPVPNQVPNPTSLPSSTSPHAPPGGAEETKSSTSTAPPRPTLSPRKGEAAASQASVVGLPPSLAASALRDELRASSLRRQEELAALGRERARLEKLAAEITAARAALKTETARLDEKVKKEKEEKEEAAKRATSAKTPSPQVRADGKPPGEVLAKTLKGMKADQAAALVSRLERRLAVDLLRHMRPADAGTVLEKMKPETAAEIFSLMASTEAAGGSR